MYITYIQRPQQNKVLSGEHRIHLTQRLLIVIRRHFDQFHYHYYYYVLLFSVHLEFGIATVDFTAEILFFWFGRAFTAGCPSCCEPHEGGELPKKVLCTCPARKLATLCYRGRSLTCLRWYAVHGTFSIIICLYPNKRSKLGLKACWRLFVRWASASIQTDLANWATLILLLLC